MSDSVNIRETRPTTFSDYVGQEQAKAILNVLTKSALKKGTAIAHTLLNGRPGLGKTTLCRIIANEMGSKLVEVVASNIHPTRHGRRADCFTRSFNKTRALAGLPKMTSHTLRHCFISNCVMSGIAFFTIAKWVGHSNSRMIEEVYGHLSPDYCKEQIGKLTVV